MTSQIITILLEWKNTRNKIIEDRVKIRDAIRYKITDMKKRYPNFPKKYVFKRFSKHMQKFIATELRDLQNEDRIVISEENSDDEDNTSIAPSKKQDNTSITPSKKQIVLEKLVGNIHLSEDDRDFLYNHLKGNNTEKLSQEYHGIEKNGINSKKRKLENKTAKEKNKIRLIERTTQTELIIQKNREIQCNILMVSDYDKCSTNLNEAYRLAPEERDLNKIKMDSKATFQKRRKHFLSHTAPHATAAKELYPFLFHLEQVFIEFELITNKKDMYSTFLKNVQKYSPYVFKCSKSLFKSEIENHINNVKKQEKNMGSNKIDKMVEIASLLVLPSYFDEERRGIILFAKEILPANHANRPFIQCNGDLEDCFKGQSVFNIFIDSIKLCTASNLFEAYFALFAAYYIFNAVYPDNCLKTFSFLEKYYIDYTDGSASFIAKDKKVKLLLKEVKE